MIEFRPIELSDQEWIEKRLKDADLMGCEYTFVNNYIWGKQYNLEIADLNGFYCTKSGSEDSIEYGFPIGEGNLKEVVMCLIEDAKERNVPFVMKSVMKEHITLLDLVMTGQFEYTLNRDDCDYVYTAEKLAKLAGKKLHGKRNHIARFKDNPDWSYEEITEDKIEECLAMNAKWCEKYAEEGSITLHYEKCAIKRAFAHFKQLKLTGGLLRVNGEVIAYSIGEPLNHNTFVVHVEKAYAEIQGAYPMMNQQFVLNNATEYEYVNREEDLGEEGLRKAKLSYYPEIILEKYRAIYKGE